MLGDAPGDSDFTAALGLTLGSRLLLSLAAIGLTRLMGSARVPAAVPARAEAPAGAS